MASNGDELKREDEFLLSRYRDGECHFVDRWRVHRLLARSSAAAQFLESLDVIGRKVTLFDSEPVRDNNGAPIKVDLWERVSRRIEEEERAAIFLGNRALRSQEDPQRVRFDLSGLAWAFTGSAVTAAVALLLIRPIGTDLFDQGDHSGSVTALNSSANEEINQVAFQQPSDSSDNDRVATFRRVGKERNLESRPVELDWVRSDGTLRMIQDPFAPSAIIWVKRKQRPLLPLSEMESGGSANPDRPVIIEERIPKTLSVGSSRSR